jgi:quinol-cytochrome oxidoreductase complex cytochrome b subunit
MGLFKLHIPILDDLKAKGVRQTITDTANDVVYRVTAGLDIEDFRGMLRGDDPARPNPRLTPHAEGFWLHMRPGYYNSLVTGVYPTFRLGWFSVFFFTFEILTGIFLMIWYTPSPLVAYQNMIDIMSNVPLGLLMRDLHRLGAELMVIVVALHMLRTFITGSYKKPRQFTWATGVVLLLLTIGLSVSGYLLPWDQLSLWAVTIGASMVEAAPPEVVGRTLNLLVRGGPDIGANGLLRFYLAHVIALPLIGLVILGVHYYKVIIHGHSLPPEDEEIGEDTARKVPRDTREYFLPTIATRELFYVFGLTLLMVIVAAYFYSAPLEPHANAQVTPLHTTAPWYMLWLQGMLKLGDKVLWGIIIPTIIFGGLLTLPYVELGPSRRYGDRRIGLSGAAVSVFLLAVLSFMGSPWYAVQSSADVEVLAELLPQTHPGPVRTTDWEQMDIGTYSAADWQSAPTPALGDILHEFDEALLAHEEELPQAEGVLVVESWQTDLKKLTFRIVWTSAESGEDQQSSQTTYLHRDSSHDITSRFGG